MPTRFDGFVLSAVVSAIALVVVVVVVAAVGVTVGRERRKVQLYIVALRVVAVFATSASRGRSHACGSRLK